MKIQHMREQCVPCRPFFWEGPGFEAIIIHACVRNLVPDSNECID